MTAVHVAALFGQTDIVQEFLSRAPKSSMFISEVKHNWRFILCASVYIVWFKCLVKFHFTTLSRNPLMMKKTRRT